MDHGAHQLIDRIAEQLGQAAVGAEDARVGANNQVGTGGVFIEIAIAGLTVLDALFGPQPFQLGAGAGGENPKDEGATRFGRHGPFVENRQVSQDFAGTVHKRHGHVTVDAAAHQGRGLREKLGHATWVMH